MQNEYTSFIEEKKEILKFMNEHDLKDEIKIADDEAKKYSSLEGNQYLHSYRYLKIYDLINKQSLREFRDICYSVDTPIMPMGGCNLWEKYMYDMRISGKKISDPYGRVFGCFDINDGVITYSPLFAHFYNERDVAKFANDSYFTTISFEEIMKYYIEHSHEFYVHIDNSVLISDFNRYGRYILEKVSSSEMIDFVNNPELGEKILKKKKH